MTAEPYLTVERRAESRSEFVNGVMYLRPGASLPRSLTAVQFASSLYLSLRGKNCKVTGSDMRFGVSRQGPFFYPDAAVYCGQPLLADEHRDVLLNPQVVVEILPGAADSYDPREKFTHYRGIETLRGMCSSRKRSR